MSPREPSGPWLACRPGPLPPAAGTCSLARLLSRTWGQGRPHRDQGRWEVSWSDDQHSLCGPQGARALKSRRRVDHPGREGLGARWARAQVPLAGLVPAPRSTRWPGPPWPRRSRGSLTRLWSPVSLPVATSKTGRGRSPSASGAGPWPGRGWPVKGHSPSSALTQAQGRRARVRAGGGWGQGWGSDWGPGHRAFRRPACPPSPHNTLFLELWCPAVAPSIIVTSDKGHTISNFGDVAVGESSLGPASPCPGTQAPRYHLAPFQVTGASRR